MVSKLISFIGENASYALIISLNYRMCDFFSLLLSVKVPPPTTTPMPTTTTSKFMANHYNDVIVYIIVISHFEQSQPLYCIRPRCHKT